MDVSEIKRVATRQHYDIKQARIDLTAALRSASRMGLSEGVCNHFSLEVPGEPDKFLINPQGLHWSEITPADLVVLNSRGKVVDGRHAVEASAFFIHYRVHAFDDLYYLERSCMVQVLALRTGRVLKLVPEEMVAHTARQMDGERQQSELHFAALKRLLDRDEPRWSKL